MRKRLQLTHETCDLQLLLLRMYIVHLCENPKVAAGGPSTPEEQDLQQFVLLWP